jgi:hypothetical protein
MNGRLASSVREIYAEAVADGFSVAMLPELPRAVAKANNIDLELAFDGAPPWVCGEREPPLPPLTSVAFAPASAELPGPKEPAPC